MRIVAVIGCSGSGKSTLAKLLQIDFQSQGLSTSILPMDNCYKTMPGTKEQRAKTNFDHPSSLDFELYAQLLRDLKEGKTVQIPTYSFLEHARQSETQTLEPVDVLIIEGILLLHSPEVAGLADLKIFVNAEPGLCLARRIHRDIKERQRSLDTTVQQWISTVYPMYLEFVEPTKKRADFIVENNSTSSDLNFDLQPVFDRIRNPQSFDRLALKIGPARMTLFPRLATNQESKFQAEEKNSPTPTVIALGGPSAAGKTSAADEIIQYYQARNIACLRIAIDRYYLTVEGNQEQKAHANYDHPLSLDKDLLVQQVKSLMEGTPVDLPFFDYFTSTRKAETERVQPAAVILIEGILALHFKEILELANHKIYVDASQGLCLPRRMQRDQIAYQRPFEVTLDQWEKTVFPMYQEFVLPSKKFADLIIENHLPNADLQFDIQPVIKWIESTNKDRVEVEMTPPTVALFTRSYIAAQQKTHSEQPAEHDITTLTL